MKNLKMMVAAQSLAIADGPTEVHKLTVARRTLREYEPVETPFPSGHLPTRKEAARFVALLNTVSAAGIACSWITREGGPGVSRIPGARLTRKAGADST